MRMTRAPFALVVPFLLGFAAAPRAHAGSVDPALAAAIAGMKPGQEVPVIVQLSDRVDLASYNLGGAGHRSTASQLVGALKAKASATQGPVLSSLTALGGRSSLSLWLVNGLAATVPNQVVTAISHLPGVETVRLDAVVSAPLQSAAVAPTATAAEWNVAMLGAPTLWSGGVTGSGIVVATLDTGVDGQHPDLSGRWRGGTNSWYDPYGQHASPYDASGHGTQTMGLIVGGSAGGTAIGVAPGAKWIAAKIFNDAGNGTVSAIHQAFQWAINPDGSGATADAPDVVSNSWGFNSTVGTCWTEFATDIATLRAAGISVVFSAGNDGGAAGTSESPANNPGALAVGALDQTRTVAPFSSRGPSACGSGTFPALTAPGVSVKSSDLTFGGVIPNSYATVSGTSFAAPQVAGALALLWSAHPSATLTAVESALTSTAVDLGVTGPDGDYGFGLPDVVAANASLSGLPAPPTASPDAYAATGGTTLAVAAPGVLGNDSSPSGKPLSALLVTAPIAGTLSLAADGSLTYAAPASGGTFTFTYQASDGTQTSSPATVTLNVAAAALPPVAQADSYSATAGKTLAPAAPGVLGNDSSPSGKPLTAILVTAPTKAAPGSFVLNGNGSFTYGTSVLTAATDSFTYKATDGTLTSAAATVTLTIAAHAAPVASADAFTVAKNSSGSALAVLANDSATNATLVPSSVSVTSAPSHGKATASSSGTVTYSPTKNFTGTDSFSYTVNDSLGVKSNVAKVTITVK